VGGAARRLDQVVMERGWFVSRSQAQDAIRAGRILVAGRPVTAPGRAVPEGTPVQLTASDPMPASRGAGKLEAALDQWGVSPRGWQVVDVGASTGGFTEAWLTRGVAKVFAVDVGVNQLRPWLAADPRVVVVDGVNARRMTASLLRSRDQSADAAEGAMWDGASIDVSFIRLELVLGAVSRLVKPDGLVLALLKPQFEVGPKTVGKGGVVRSREAVRAVLERYWRLVAEWNLHLMDVMACPVLGRGGNRELWLALTGASSGHGRVSGARLDEVLTQAFGREDGGS